MTLQNKTLTSTMVLYYNNFENCLNRPWNHAGRCENKFIEQNLIMIINVFLLIVLHRNIAYMVQSKLSETH